MRMDKQKKKTVGGILALIVTSAPPWIQLFFDHGEQILGSFAPVVWILWPILVALVGVFTGWNAHKWYLNREEEKQEKDREARDISNFKALEYDFKYLVGTIYAFGYVDYPDYEYENGLLQFFPNEVPYYLEIETIQDGVRVTLQKWVKDLINSNKYLLDCVKDDYRAEEMK